MLGARVNAAERRINLRSALAGDELLQFPGAFNPLAAKMIESFGFEGVYVSGAVMSAELGLPDIGLTTLTEVAQRSGQIATMTNLPTIMDADTGFGEPMNVARTIQVLEDSGLAGAHIEDQVNPKRCGHLDGKEVVDIDTAAKRMRAAAQGRRDENFLIIARTDIRAQASVEATIERSLALIEAGAEVIFPEALRTLDEFEQVASALPVPVLANMTEFGKSELFSAEQLKGAGVRMVIYPVTLLRLAMGAAHAGLSAIKNEGSQNSVVGQMQTRAELYELLQYADYNVFDEQIFTYRASE